MDIAYNHPALAKTCRNKEFLDGCLGGFIQDQVIERRFGFSFVFQQLHFFEGCPEGGARDNGGIRHKDFVQHAVVLDIAIVQQFLLGGGAFIFGNAFQSILQGVGFRFHESLAAEELFGIHTDIQVVFGTVSLHAGEVQVVLQFFQNIVYRHVGRCHE